jgi:hypothetical protein
VNTVVRIIDRRCRLLGLYTQPEIETPMWRRVVPEAGGNPGVATDAEAVGVGVGSIVASAA